MSISKKFNIPEDTVRKMVKEGVISCSIARNYDIVDYYNSFKASNPHLSNSAIIYEVASKMNVSYDSVHKAVYTIGKKL